MSEKKDWKYCVVGNIVKERIDDNGIPRHGTAAFRGGAKVYLCGKGWTFSDTVISALGLTRGKHYQVIDTRMADIENLRVQKVYNPGLLAVMNNFEFKQYWWGDTSEDKEDAEAFITKWNSKWVGMMIQKQKYYPYSVRECLMPVFGNDPLQRMRHPPHDDKCCSDQDRLEKYLPLCWQCADKEVLDTFSEISFLTDTILTDDYIAYKIRRGNEDEAILLFMTEENNPLFRMKIEYAKYLDTEWRAKGFQPIFFNICVGTTYYSKGWFNVTCGDQRPEGVFILQ